MTTLDARAQAHPCWRRDGFEVSTDPARLDRAFIHRELAATYWAAGRSRAAQDKANDHSICFGVYAADGRQVGFARLVTDRATFAYLADVFIVESERGKGLGVWLNECVVAHPELQGLRRWILATKSAHGLYEKMGWKRLTAPERFMERFSPNPLEKGAAAA